MMVPILPILLMHGMGDSIEGMTPLVEKLQSWYPGTHVKALSLTGEDDVDADRKASFFGKLTDQVARACVDLKEDDELKNGFSAVGFSQGGLFWRTYIQHCNDPPIKTLITFGSPHAGTADIPNCLEESVYCSLMRSVVSSGVYWSWVQNQVIQAQYYKTWANLDAYYEGNIFLPDLNQEGPLHERRPEYTARLKSVKKLVLIRFMNDTMIVPRDTAWWSFFNEEGVVIPLLEQNWYKKNGLGLKDIYERGSIDFLSLPGEHMQFTIDDFKYLSDTYLKTSTLSTNEVDMDESRDGNNRPFAGTANSQFDNPLVVGGRQEDDNPIFKGLSNPHHLLEIQDLHLRDL